MYSHARTHGARSARTYVFICVRMQTAHTHKISNIFLILEHSVIKNSDTYTLTFRYIIIYQYLRARQRQTSLPIDSFSVKESARARAKWL